MSFEIQRFEWRSGAFLVAGRWAQPPPPGRVRLLVDVDGRRRRIAAQGPADASADAPWRARFAQPRRPAAVGSAELEIGGELVVVLPPAEVAPEPPPDVGAAQAVLESVRAERAALEAALSSLAAERKAAQVAAERLSQQRARAERSLQELDRAVQLAREGAERAAREAAERGAREAAVRPPMVWSRPGPAETPAPTVPSPPTPRRAASRELLELPREPRTILPAGRRDRRNAVAYVLAATLLMGIVVAAVLVL